ncbi:MAG: glycosyltransferase [Phycisphaerales bacterium]
MRIVLLNWAPIAEGAARGGGINGYTRALAQDLLRRGHEVAALSGGTAYEPGPIPGEPGPCRIRKLPAWQGIQRYEVLNSPVLAPALPQFRDPRAEVSSPGLEREVARLIAELRPDAVHIQSLEGFSAGCIAAIGAAAPGARVVFSLHNYHTICPQVYLMQGHRRPCHSFDGGRACDGCIPTVDPAAEKRRLATGDSTPAEFEWKRPENGNAGREEPGGESVWRGLLRRFANAPPAEAGAPTAPPPAPFIPPPLWSEAWITMPARRPLLNIVHPEPACAGPPNAYGQRRLAMIEAINRCDTVLAVSDFVRRKYETLGVRPEVLRTLHIGTRLGVAPGGVRSEPDPATPRSRPIRLAFMGYNNWYKGLPMLLESLALLTPEVLGRFHLHIFALGGEPADAELAGLRPRLAGLTVREGYSHDELPALLAGIDLGLVTSVWWDNGPQTVLEFLACGIPVLGAQLGGIPDFIQDGVNGLLFRGNDRWDLARRLAGIAAEPAVLARLRDNVKPPKTMTEHTSELEAIYGARVS